MTNDDADKITAELSAKVAKMNSFLAALEEALTTTTTTTTQNKKTGTEGGKEEEDDDALVKAEHLLERVELGLLAFAALLKTKGVDSETHEGLKSERKRVEAYKRKLEETKRRVKKTEKDDNKTAAGGGGGGGEEGEIRNDDSGKNGSSNRDNNKRLREEGEIPRANNRVASRFVFNALGGSRTAEKDRLKQEAAAKLRRSIEEDVKNKFEEKVNEKYREKQSRGSVGKNKKKKNDSDAKPDIEEGEYSE